MTKRVSTSTTVALWVCLSLTIGLFVVSFFIPPKGVIDASIFKAAGFLFGFATLFEVREAIREGLGVRLTHGHTTLEVHDLDGPGPHHGPGHPMPGYQSEDPIPEIPEEDEED